MTASPEPTGAAPEVAPVPAVNRARLGKANRDKGARAERDLVKWLRVNGWPGAERAVRTGYRTTNRTSADPGDVTGTPGIVWQVKHSATFDEPAKLARHLAATEQQRAAATADLGLLVQRRTGAPDAGRWWVHITGRAFAQLLTGQPAPDFDCTARVTLAELVPLLHRAGYGTRPEEDTRA